MTSEACDASSRLKLPHLVLLGLLPWVWVGIGFYLVQSLWLTILLYAGASCLLPFLLCNRQRICFFPRQIVWRLVLLLIVVIATTLLGGWLSFTHVLIDWPHFHERIGKLGLDSQPAFYLLAFYFVLFNPVIEESFWRGLIYHNMKQVISPRKAMLLSSLLFGGWHWLLVHPFFVPAVQVPVTVLIVLGGLLFAWLYDRTESLLIPVVVHGLGADLPIMLILWHALYTPH